MAKAKAEKKKLVTRTAALTHGKAAFGASRIKPGFAWDESRDLAFALGYPHFLELAEGHPDDADPTATADRMCKEAWVSQVVGAETAPRLLRGYGNGCANAVKAELKASFAAEIARAAPMTVDEASAIVRKMIQSSNVYNLSQSLLLAEALVGPDAVVDAALAGLAEVPAPIVSGTNTQPKHTRALVTVGLMLLRLLPEARERALGVWRGLDERWRREAPRPRSPILDGSAAVLDPKANVVKEMGPVLELDDPAAVRAFREGLGKLLADDLPDPRLVFLGGEEVYALELATWSKYTSSLAKIAEVHAVIIERFGAIRSPTTTKLMAEMAAKSKAKKLAEAWLAEHPSV